MRTDPLPETHADWSQWADFLRRRRLDGAAVWMLEAATPVMALAAQALYWCSPFLQPMLKEDQCAALANLLEDPLEAHSFAAFLREERSL